MYEDIIDKYEDDFDDRMAENEGFDDRMADSFEEYDAMHERETALPVIRAEQALAPQRRAAGHRKLANIASFETNARRKADLAGKPVEEVYFDMLRRNPERVEQIKSYVASRGLTPSNDIEQLAVQAAKSRHAHVAEVQSNYDPECFDADNFLFDSKERKAMRKKRRATKWKRREDLRAKRQDVRMAKQQKRLDKANEREKEEPEEQPQEEQAQLQNPSSNVAESTSADNKEIMDLASPSPDDAHAEIIGEELEQESYYGDADADNFLPFLAGAINLGAKIISGGKIGKNDLKNLMKKKEPNAEARGLSSKDSAGAVNEGIKKIVETIETEKKKDFFKKNAVWIVLSVVVLLFVGYKIAKH